MFRAAVVEAMDRIPDGRAVSYAWVAHHAGWPGRAQSVGREFARDPSGVPWWRVVYWNGRLSARGREDEQARRLRADGIAVADGKTVERPEHVRRPSRVAALTGILLIALITPLAACGGGGHGSSGHLLHTYSTADAIARDLRANGISCDQERGAQDPGATNELTCMTRDLGDSSTTTTAIAIFPQGPVPPALADALGGTLIEGPNWIVSTQTLDPTSKRIAAILGSKVLNPLNG